MSVKCAQRFCLTIRVHPKTWVQLGSKCCQIRYKTGYYDTEQSQANQSDRFLFSSLQAGGRGFDPGHVHQSFQ
jgi:hypothetical protein